VSNNAAMNQMFLDAGRRGKHVGVLSRLTGEPTPTSSALRERLSSALNSLEAAKRAGDDVMVDVHESMVDRVVEEARAARKPDESGEGAGQPQRFDGGVRGRRSPPSRGLSQESASSLFVRAMVTSQQERTEREADAGQTITANF
jgi:hypothetical protein